MQKYTIFIHTRGMGAGHLSRVNAVYKGFVKAQINVRFCACMFNSAYKHLLNPEIELFEKNNFPNNIDIFICDWRPDKYTDALPKSLARLWVALTRLKNVPSVFPPHYRLIAIEPEVEGEQLFYPIINTYPDELKSRNFLLHYIGKKEIESKEIVLFGENGTTADQVNTVFNYDLGIENLIILKSSNNPFFKGKRPINYYPLAELFNAVDYLVIGGGYNSSHEALCYADLDKTKMIDLGGDDQGLRISKILNWERKQQPENHLLASYMIAILEND